MADINNIDIQTLTEHIQSYMEVEEILTVIPICFFNNDCPQEIEDAFFRNHYQLCDKHNIHRLNDWVNKDITAKKLASDIEESVTD